MQAGSVATGDASTIASTLDNVESQVGNISSSWHGPSYDTFSSKFSNFISEYKQPIIDQLTKFGTACDNYIKYEEKKNLIKTKQAEYDKENAKTGEDRNQSLIDSLENEITTLTEDAVELKTLIADGLSEANSPKLEATALNSTIASDLAAVTGGAKGEFVYYNQGNYSDPYSQGTIATSGCGPTALAMVLTYLTGKEVSPSETAAKGNGTYTCSKGTTWNYFGDMAQQYGVQCTQMEPSSSNIKDNLNNGKTLILSMGPGDFTKRGHFIVARGLDQNGNLVVADPSSTSRTNKVWNVDRVASQCKQIWAMSN